MQLAAFNNNNFHLGQASVSINEGSRSTWSRVSNSATTSVR